MLVNIDDTIINTDDISYVTEALPDRHGSPQSTARMRDGTTCTLPISPERFEHFCGTIVAALPGYRLATAHLPSADETDQSVHITFEPVLAFRIVPGAETPVLPITADGQVSNRTSQWAIVDPEGGCTQPGLDQHSDVEAFRCAMARETAERRERLNSSAA